MTRVPKSVLKVIGQRPSCTHTPHVSNHVPLCMACAEKWSKEVLDRLERTEVDGIIIRGLPKREAEAVAHVMHGRNTKETAKLMGLSPRTVEAHINNTMGKLGARNRVHIVAILRGYGLLTFTAALAPTLEPIHNDER